AFSGVVHAPKSRAAAIRERNRERRQDLRWHSRFFITADLHESRSIGTWLVRSAFTSVTGNVTRRRPERVGLRFSKNVTRAYRRVRGKKGIIRETYQEICREFGVPPLGG